MLKQTLLATATTAALLSPIATFASGFGQGTITFNGSVTEAPCSIAPGDTNLTIELGQISQKGLDANGKFSTSVPVNIRLTTCSFEPGTGSPPGNPKLSKVGISFNGGILDAAKGQITNTGDATNVAIQLLKDDNTTPLNFTTSNTAAQAQQLQPGNNTLSYFARIAATGKATPGSVIGNTIYTLHYF